MSATPVGPADTRPYLLIRLMRRTLATTFPGALGFSLPFAHRGAHVLIFHDRVETLTRSVSVQESVVLGCTVAHELARVLMGSTEHTAAGLMQARWTPTSWSLASQGLVSFNGVEIELMRARLLKSVAKGPGDRKERSREQTP